MAKRFPRLFNRIPSSVWLAAMAASLLVVTLTAARISMVRTDGDASWVGHEVYAGARVNSATAADYDGDGSQEIIFSAAGQVLMLHGPEYKTKQVLATLEVKRPKGKAQCIHSVLHDVDHDGDLDFVGSHVRGLFWLECPGENATTTTWKAHQITDEIHGVHCIRSFDIDRDGTLDLVANDFSDGKGPYSGSICWLRPSAPPATGGVKWSIIEIARGSAPGGSHYFDFGDVNGDGRPDFTLGAKGKPFANGNYFAVFYSPEDPAQPWRREFLPDHGGQTGATHAAPADVNGDGEPDILASRGHGNGVVWFEGPDWTEHVIDEDILFPHATDFGDIDGDGDIDLSTVGFGSKLAAWYENDGRGNFTRHTLSRNQMAYDTMITDLDGDGDMDILVAGQKSENVIWFENPGKKKD
ncbi:MAG: hypothetical protein CMO35_00990 [Verrucomicrobiaceae bacterium]|jgi:hypothetical protein|nr:hypothetical protein [Verrucomicrobiaceae bacterium]